MSLPESHVRPSSRLRVSSLSSSSKFPLPDDAFAFARLTRSQLHAHQQQIQQLIAQTLDECDRAECKDPKAYSCPWEVAGVQDHLTALWRHEIPTTSTTSNKSQYRIVGDVVGDYRDLMALYYADTSHDLFEWLQFTNQSTLDTHVIQTVESQSPNKPHQYFGVKWAVFQPSKFATKVDECFVEYMTYCKDRRGREVGVRVTLPVCIPEIDVVTEDLKVRRMASQIVQIFRLVNDKTTRVFVQIENAFLPAAPAAYVKTLLTQTLQSAMSMDARRIRRRGLLAEKHWMPKASRSCCVVCTRTFGATRLRHHCRLCGEVICRKCTVLRDTADPITHKTFKLVKTKFCLLCIVHLRGRNAAASGHTIAAADLSASTVAAVRDGGELLGDFAELIEEMAVDKSSSDTSSRQSRRTLLLSDDTTESTDCIETIDTKDMMRGNTLGMEDDDVESTRSASRVLDDCASLLSERLTRSLDENLAEQEALLRQLAKASQGVGDSNLR